MQFAHFFSKPQSDADTTGGSRHSDLCGPVVFGRTRPAVLVAATD
jgi:hypothetical protein